MAAIRSFCLLAVAIALLGAAPAAAQVDVNKLKPGDKLELDDFGMWVKVEFVEKISDQMVRVQRPDFPAPVGALVRKLRLAKVSRAKKEAPAEDPFATPEEKIAQKAKERTWTDPSGKFKVDATLVRVDGDGVVLKRHDGKEVTVPAARLSEADRAYLKEILPPSANSGIEDAVAAATEILQRVPVKMTNLPAATQCSLSPDVEWTYTPAVAAPEMALRPVQLSLQPTSVHTRATRLLIAPAEKKAFAVFEETQFGGKDPLIHVQACDLSRRKVESAGTFGVGIAPLAVSPDGTTVVARSERGGFGGQSELQLYERDGNRVKPSVAWFPYRHHPSPFANSAVSEEEAKFPERPRLWRDADVSWADFLDPNHLMTISMEGELAVWKLPEIEPVYYLAAESVVGGMFLVPAMSAGSAYFALPTKDGVALVRSKDGTEVGFLPGDMTGVHVYRLAWSDDGTRLALLQPDRLRVWDLTKREMMRDFPVAIGRVLQDCGWVGNTHVFINGHVLVDVDRRIPVLTTSKSFHADPKFAGGISWALVHRGLSPATVEGTAPMPKNFKDPAAGKTAEELLVIQPGWEVAVDLPPGNTPDGVDPRAAVIERLEKNGMKVVADSKIRLVGTLKSGGSKTVHYTTFGIHRKTMETSVTEQILTLSFTVDGVTVWKHESRQGAPHSVSMKEGESIGQAIARVRKLDGSDFGRVWIPAWVARVPDELQAALEGKPKGA